MINQLVSFKGSVISPSLRTNNIQQRGVSFKSEINSTENVSNKQKKITFSEGVKLVFNGFKTQLKNLVSSVIEHPVRTLATGLATTVGLMALPIIGIPTAVGGAALALGFGAFGAAKFISNTAKAVKNCESGEYNKARANLKSIGESTLDLALSLPFVPKAIKSVKEFTKYGKIGVNSSLVADLKNTKGIFAKFKTLNNANTELTRSVNYQSVLDKKLDALTLSSQDKAMLKHKLLKLNVSDDKLFDVVVEEFMKSKGLSLKPEVVMTQTTKYNYGSYSPTQEKIYMKDYSKPDLPATASNTGRKVRKTTPRGNIYDCEIIDLQTGKITHDVISKQVFDDYMALDRASANLSRKSKQVATVIHESEHMCQHGEIARLYGHKGKPLMKSYVQQKGRLTPHSPEYLQALKYKNARMHYTSVDPIAYLNNELELGARAMEMKAIQSQEFKLMDKVFKGMDLIKNPTYTDTIVPAVVQANNFVS